MQSDKPKFIGPRISYLKTKDQLSVIISQEISRVKESLLIGWLLAWTFCGILFIHFLVNSETRDERLFLSIVLAFWAFFFVRIGKVFFWRKAGREMIRITPGQLSIKNSWWNYGKAKTFFLDNIREISVMKKDPSNFMQSLDRSFWVVGGETIRFKYLRKTIQFGKQLKDQEAVQLAKLIERNVKDFRNKSTA